MLLEATFNASHTPKGIWKTDQKVIHNQPSPFRTSRIQAPGHPKNKFLPLRKKFGQHFIALKGTEEVDQLRREARKGRKWSFVGKGKDKQQRKEKLGHLPHVLSTPRSRWEALRLSQGTPPPSQAGRGPGRCPSSGDVSLPPSQRGTRRPAIARGAHPLPYPRAHSVPRVPCGAQHPYLGNPSHRCSGRTHNQTRRSHARPAPSWGWTPAVPSRFVIEQS